MPTGLSATVMGATRIDLNFSAPANATQIAVERSLDNRVFAQIALLQTPVSGYINGGLRRHTTYWHRVRAGNAAGWSAFTESVAAKTERR